jgi:PHD/YefM family antitoxin component YafN of YafNO toxin-antitoxin module
LFVTTNGETEAVVLSPSAFDELMDQADLARSLALLDRSMEDIKAGRTRPAKAAIQQIADELNLTLDR